MARPIFEKRRGDRPLQVRVSATGMASVAGTPVPRAADEDVHDAVLNHLHHLATAHGTPIRATIHDDAAGCLVPLEISPDGTTRMTGSPTRLPAAPGTVQPPRGVFGPPPVMEPRPPAGPERAPAPQREPRSAVTATAARRPEPRPAAVPAPELVLGPEPVPEVAPGPVPPSRFDAVAEELLAERVEGAEVSAAAWRRVGDAVGEGQVERAAELASRAVAEVSGALGPRHPEVLHLRELCAYVAYLSGDPDRAFELSLDLARRRAETGDPAAAYGNVRSAATAWRAVRDPGQGLRMGRELIEVWTTLAAEPGPAAADPRPLQSARTRMDRLTDRAAAAGA